MSSVVFVADEQDDEPVDTERNALLQTRLQNTTAAPTKPRRRAAKASAGQKAAHG